MNYFTPRGTHGQILKPYNRSWQISQWKSNLPTVIENSKIIFTPDQIPFEFKGRLFAWYAEQGFLGVQLSDENVLAVKMADLQDTIPSKFDDLLIQAEDDLEAETAELLYNPFQ